MNIHSLEDYQKYILSIVDKGGSERRFTPNFYQRQLNKLAEDRSKPLRLLILKCRQIGASTWGTSFIYHRTATQFNKSGLVIADDVVNTQGLFSMAKKFYENSPEEVRPMQRYSNENKLEFNNPNKEDEQKGLGSQILVATAGKLSAGRSKTLQYLHCSEFAYWPNAATLATGLFQAVPYLPNTGIIIESTANGISGKGEEFYNRCMRALDGDSTFKFCFFNWLDNPEYEITPPQGFKRTPEEDELARRYPALTDRKLMFRRYKIENEMGSAIVEPRDQFKQEYPLTPEEAFVSSGRPVFNSEDIHAAIRRVKETVRPICGRMDGVGFVEDQRGNIRIYHGPKSGQAYAIGADVAEGIEGGDFSTASVLDKDFNQVAVYHGHIDPDRFGDLLVKLAKFYNGAVLAPEINNHGHATLAAIKNLGYHKLFKRVVPEELGSDIQDKVGWQTNTKTKMLMIDELVKAFRDSSVKINDEATLREMMTLTVEDDGDISLNGKDRVVALAISIQALRQAVNNGEYKAIVPNRVVPKDVTRMTVQEKMNYYKRLQRNG